MHGEFPKNCFATTQINILDRIDFADRLFRALWRNLGGTFRGQPRESVASDAPTAGMRLLAQHQSRTLAEVTRDINKRSDNPITRQLYLNHPLAAGTTVRPILDALIDWVARNPG